jgi:hypothetical protein
MTNLRRRVDRVEGLRMGQSPGPTDESSIAWLERKWRQGRAALDADYRRRHHHSKLEIGQPPIEGCSECVTDPPPTFDEVSEQLRADIAAATDPVWTRIYWTRLRELDAARKATGPSGIP